MHVLGCMTGRLATSVINGGCVPICLYVSGFTTIKHSKLTPSFEEPLDYRRALFYY